MTGYTKLFSSIIHSTIWREADHIRLVWVTMMAMADQDGLVGASVPGLADAARVTIEQCEEALSKLMAPDKYSRSKDFEGRRVTEVDGGWALLNHGKYKDLMSRDDQKAKAAERQRRKRERDRVSRDNRDMSRTVTPSHACHDIAEAEAYTKEEGSPPISPPGGKPKKRATQIPKDWAPNEAHIALCSQHKLNIGIETEKFRDHAISKGRTLKDWDAGFRNWLRNAAQYARNGPGSVPTGPGGIPLVSWGAKNHAANMAALEEDRRIHEVIEKKCKQDSEQDQPCIPGVVHRNSVLDEW